MATATATTIKPGTRSAHHTPTDNANTAASLGRRQTNNTTATAAAATTVSNSAVRSSL
jgi:hypothetical protein